MTATENNYRLVDSIAKARQDQRMDIPPTIEDLLQQAYQVHLTITKGLHEQVASLSQLLAQKEHEVKNASCHRCNSVKDTFEKYKAAHQQIAVKQETKIELLEQRLLAFEKDQRERSVASRHGSSTSALRKNILSAMNESIFHEMDGSSILVFESEDDSPVGARDLVPPSPLHSRKQSMSCASPSLRARVSPNRACGKDPASQQDSPSLLAKVSLLSVAKVEARGGTETAKTEHLADNLARSAKNECLADDVSSRTSAAAIRVQGRDFELPAVNSGRPPLGPPTVPESPVAKSVEENLTATCPVESPSLLRFPAHSRAPPTTDPHKEERCANADEVVEAEPVLKPAEDGDYDPSQSLLKALASVSTRKVERDPKGTSGDEVPTDLVSVDLTLSTQESDPSRSRTEERTGAGRRLFSDGEQCRGPKQASGSCRTSPPRKKKKQTKLSSRYFLAVNRHSPIARTLEKRRELSQTKLGQHRSEGKLVQESMEDLDETRLPLETLQIAKVSVPADIPVPDVSQVPDVNPKKTEAAQDSGRGGSSDPPEVVHKFHNTPVRGREARLRLPAHDCKECQDFYERAGNSRRQELLKKCSRHRALHAPPATPDNFWELDFPDTQECRARGYLNETLNDAPNTGSR